MEFNGARLEPSSRVQQRASDTATDAWPRRSQRRRKTSSTDDDLGLNEDTATGSESEEKRHQLDDIA